MYTYSHKRRFLILFTLMLGSFVAMPADSIAQDNIKNRRLLWSVRFYPADRRHLEVVVDTRPGGTIARDVRFDVYFYSATNTFLGGRSFRFTDPNDELASNKYVRYVPNPYPTAAKVRGGKLYYMAWTPGRFYNCVIGDCPDGRPRLAQFEDAASALNDAGEFNDLYSNVHRLAPGVYRPRGGYAWMNSDPNDFRVELMPGLVRVNDSHLRPVNGYEWVNPNDPQDFRTQLKIGLERGNNGNLRPANGYEWVNNDPNDLRVTLIPGLTRDTEGTFRPAPGYTWVDPASRTDLRVRRLYGH